MGYSTDFSGRFEITPPLPKEKVDYINLLSTTRRMKRDVNILWEMYKGKHGNPFATEQTPEAVYGNEGEYFALDDGNFGQSGHGTDKSILDYNTAPGQLGYDGTSDFESKWTENQRREKEGLCQPGLWCQWNIEDEGANGQFLAWDGGEKFYNYIEWLKYYINHFFSKWGVLLNGEVEWFGEDYNDRGKIIVVDNVVKVLRGSVVFNEE